MKKLLTIILPFVCISLAAQQKLSLPQLLDSAMHNNIAIRTAQYDIEVAGQQRKEAFTKYFPNVTASGVWFNANRGMAKMEMNPTELIPADLQSTLALMLPSQMLASLANPISMEMMKDGTIAAIMAMQPVFAGGQIVNGNRLARVGEDVSRLKLQLSENEVTKTMEQYFWQMASLQEKMRTVNSVEALIADIAKDVEVAVKAGVAMRNDLLQVQLRQNEIASQKLKLQNGITLMRLLMSQFAGLKCGDNFDIIVPDINAEDVPLPSPMDENGVARTPEYQLMQKQVEAASLQKKIAVGKNLPSVAVGAGYTYHNLLDNDRDFGMILATVSVPITDWWGGSHAIKRRKIELRKAEEQLEDNAQKLHIRVQSAWNSVIESYQQLLLAQSGIEQASENMRLNRDFYAAGTSRMADLLEAQMLYQQACDRRTDAYAEYRNKLLAYRQSVGM